MKNIGKLQQNVVIIVINKYINICQKKVKVQKMNVTYQQKHSRDHLIQLNQNTSNPSYIHENIINIKQKEIQGNNSRNKSKCKNQQQNKIKNLYQIIDNFRYQNQSMNAMVKNKNLQIINLKKLLKGHQHQFPHQQKIPMKQVYYMNNFKSIIGQPPSINSTELDRAYYQIHVLTKQRDDLIKIIQQLQQQKLIQPTPKNINQPNYISSARSYNASNTNVVSNDNVISNQQHSKIVQQYEQHIAAMASKLSTVHKLQIQIANLQQDKNLLLHQHQGMRNQLINRVGYCQHLQNQIRKLQQQQQQRGGGGFNYSPNQTQQIQNLLTKNNTLQQQISKLNKNIKQKDQKLTTLQSKNNGCLQLTKQAFQSIQNNISTLQQKVNTSTQVQKKQAQKNANLQIQVNRLTRQLSQKIKKSEQESDQKKKLQHEKTQLNTIIKKQKNQIQQIQKKYEQMNIHYKHLSNNYQKKQKQQLLIKSCINQLQIQKNRTKQLNELIKKLQQRITTIQQKCKYHQKQYYKSIKLIEQYKLILQKNEKKINEQNEIINRLNQKNNRRLDQLDINIKNNINLQDKLRQFSQKHQSLSDQIQQYIKINYYVKSSCQ